MAEPLPEVAAVARIEAARRSGARDLDLSHLGLRELPDAIASLTALQSLNLRRNHLTALPDAIASLTALQSLNLMSNQLTTLPDAIASLTALQSLNLWDNELTALPDALASLTALQSLNLSYNRLTALPDAIASLTALQSLDLEDNRLTALPDAIAGLTALESLDLGNNQLTALPDAIANLTALRELFLHENDGLGIPPEILGPDWRQKSDDNPAALPADILRYYFRARTEATRPLNEAKIILVGQGDVGKTSLVKRLVHGAFDAEEAKTPGIDITPWALPAADGADPVRLNVWDFGGQEIMHATHRFFLTHRSLYLLVLDGRKGAGESNIQYWLEIIRSYGGDSPIIVVANKSDQQTLALDERRLKLDYEANLRSFISTSARTGAGIETLKAAIGDELAQLGHIRDAVPESYFKVKQQLQVLSAESDFVTSGDYAELCRSHGVTEPGDQESLLRFLHDLGNVLHYDDPDDPYHLGDTNILNPEWVTGGVYRILNDRDLLLAGGTLERAAVRRILGDDPRYPAERHDFILGMMRKFELCFDFPDAIDQRLLVPELLNPNELELGWDLARTLNFQYAYSVLPGGILPRFIVRMSHALSDWRDCWRSGVVLKFDANTALVRADSYGNRIHVAIDGPAAGRRGALRVIRECFKAIHASVPRLGVREMVPLPDAPEIVVAYQHLLKLEENGQTEYWPEGAGRAYRVADLLNGIEDPERRRQERDRQREFAGPGERLAEKTKRENAANKHDVLPGVSPSPLITVAGLAAVVVLLMAALVWLANQVGDNTVAVMVLASVAVVVSYPLLLFAALATNLIDQKTFSKLSLAVLEKIAALNPAKSDGDD